MPQARRSAGSASSASMRLATQHAFIFHAYRQPLVGFRGHCANCLLRKDSYAFGNPGLQFPLTSNGVRRTFRRAGCIRIAFTPRRNVKCPLSRFIIGSCLWPAGNPHSSLEPLQDRMHLASLWPLSSFPTTNSSASTTRIQTA